MNKIDIYKLVSRIFDPIILMPIGFIILTNFFEVTLNRAIILSIIQIVIPLGIFFFMVQKGKIDLDVTDRLARIPILILMLVSTLVVTVLLFIWRYTEYAMIQLSFTLTIGIFLLITTKWKISAHSLVNTFYALILGYYINQIFYLLGFLVLIAVYKSRLILKKHTLPQLLAGSLLALLPIITIILFNNSYPN